MKVVGNVNNYKTQKLQKPIVGLATFKYVTQQEFDEKITTTQNTIKVFTDTTFNHLEKFKETQESDQIKIQRLGHKVDLILTTSLVALGIGILSLFISVL